MNNRFSSILIEGLPRTGKKELGRKLSKVLKFSCALEIQSIPSQILTHFYREPEKNALLTELSFLIQRYKQFTTLMSDLYQPNKYVFTFSMEKSKIYAAYTLSDYELRVFEKIYEMLSKPLPIAYDVIVFLYTKPSDLLKRIRKNPKEGEGKISKEYLDGLLRVFYNHFSKQTGVPVVFFDVKNFECGFDEQTVENLADFLQTAKIGINFFDPLTSCKQE